MEVAVKRWFISVVFLGVGTEWVIVKARVCFTFFKTRRKTAENELDQGCDKKALATHKFFSVCVMITSQQVRNETHGILLITYLELSTSICTPEAETIDCMYL